MDYLARTKHHYKPSRGWMNDPNGLVYFDGYYHAFYQYAPNHETPFVEPMTWGHARTKDFITWEELPVALRPEHSYEDQGCWSGTAIVKDDVLYLFYASVTARNGKKHRHQSVSVAYSKDGINFTKYENNPVIEDYPADGSEDFRDPAVFFDNGRYYCVMASGQPEIKKARLLLYESEDLLSWKYKGIMYELDNANVTECPAVVRYKDKFLVAMSVLTPDDHYFTVACGDFKNGVFTPDFDYNFDRGPDQYAGQAFMDKNGRSIIFSWVPGWSYNGFAEKSLGCLSLPRELTVRDGKVCAYPVKEVQHLLCDSDPAVTVTDDGFTIARAKGDVVHKGEVRDIKMLRDEYILEVFVNGGEVNYTVVL